MHGLDCVEAQFRKQLLKQHHRARLQRVRQGHVDWEVTSILGVAMDDVAPLAAALEPSAALVLTVPWLCGAAGEFCGAGACGSLALDCTAVLSAGGCEVWASGGVSGRTRVAGGGAAAVLIRASLDLLSIASEAMRKRARRATQDTRADAGKDKHVQANEM